MKRQKKCFVFLCLLIWIACLLCGCSRAVDETATSSQVQDTETICEQDIEKLHELMENREQWSAPNAEAESDSWHDPEQEIKEAIDRMAAYAQNQNDRYEDSGNIED